MEKTRKWRKILAMMLTVDAAECTVSYGICRCHK